MIYKLKGYVSVRNRRFKQDGNAVCIASKDTLGLHLNSIVKNCIERAKETESEDLKITLYIRISDDEQLTGLEMIWKEMQKRKI